MMSATIQGIEYYLPKQRLTNHQLREEFPDWNVDRVTSKTGIDARAVAEPDQCASDLAVIAAEQLFASGLEPEQVDFVILCTQTPDYYLPTTACILQERLGLPTTTGALDFNLGCSGYVYGLGLAKGLIETGQAENVLLLTAETYTKLLDPADKSLRSIFGDGAAATWISSCHATEPKIGPFVYGTDGGGAENLIVRRGAMRDRGPDADPFLRMNGSEIFTFTLRAVPDLVQATLDKAGIELGSIDRFVFHQANQFMIEHLRTKIGIEPGKFSICMAECGNTVSNSIPIALKNEIDTGQIKPGDRLMLVGFGVGYSWGATLVQWSPNG